MTDAEISAQAAQLRAARVIIAAALQMRAAQKHPSIERSFVWGEHKKVTLAYEDHLDRLLALWAEAEAEGIP